MVPAALSTTASAAGAMSWAAASSGWISMNGCGDVAGKPRRQARARHRVPLVPDAAGVEDERKGGIGRRGGGGRRRHEASATVRRVEAAVGVEAARRGGDARGARRHRPLHRGELSVLVA